MDQQQAGDARRAPGSGSVRRAVILAALGTGLWLGGETTADAQELPPPPGAGDVVPAAIGGVAEAADGLIAPVTSVPAVAAPASPVNVAPVVTETAETVRSVTAPVADVVPVVQAAAPVVEVAAPLGEVAGRVLEPVERAVSPVVEPFERAVPPVTDAVEPPVAPGDPQVAPAVDAAGREPGTVVRDSGQLSPEAGSRRMTDSSPGSVGDTAWPAGVLTVAPGDVSAAAGPTGEGSAPLPAEPRTPVAGGPGGARCSGAHSADQMAADVSAAVATMTTAALVASGEVRQAACDIAADPSFSPD